MSTNPSNVIHFVPRRKRPRVCIAIRGSMFDSANSLAALAIVAANDQDGHGVT